MEKRGIVIGEFRRAINRSTSDTLKLKSLLFVFQKFLNNDYPFDFLLKCFYSFCKNTMHPKDKKPNNDFVYIKMPYINEQFCFCLHNVLKRLDLHSTIRFYFFKPRSLRTIFSPHKEKITCAKKIIFVLKKI